MGYHYSLEVGSFNVNPLKVLSKASSASVAKFKFAKLDPEVSAFPPLPDPDFRMPLLTDLRIENSFHHLFAYQDFKVFW
jgi:hypothetical protein